MKFKEPHMEDELMQSPEMLQQVALTFDSLSRDHGIVPVVTRVWGHIDGDSGVHAAQRAVDYRDEIRDGNRKRFLYTVDIRDFIVAEINRRYPRTDGKLVAIHHSFQGAPFHFHLQIPIDWV